jgi:helix-turn-helix protein
MDYKHLTDEQKSQITLSTIQNIETDHFANTLAKARAEAVEDVAQIKYFTKVLLGLEKQHAELTKVADAAA